MRAVERSGEYRASENHSGACSEDASAKPTAHNPRKQRKNPAAAGWGERFREGKWRSGRDSNPRDPSGPAPLAGVCLRPLGHHSACPYIGQVQGKQGLFGLHQESSLSDCFHEFSWSFPRTVRPIRADGFAAAFQACDAPRHGGSRGRAPPQRPVRTLRIRQDDARWRPAARPNRGVEAAFHAAAARPVLEPLPGQARPARIQSECGGGDCFGAARDLPKKTTVRNRLSRLDREHRGMRLMSSIFSGATSR